LNVNLQLAGEAEMPIVRHFFLSYFYDMSQYDDNLIINDAGLPMWEPFGLPGPQTPDECIKFNWWIRDLCQHYIIRVDERPAGFVIICAAKEHLPEGVEYELMDFYITPKYQRNGIGKEAARQALDLFHGNWCVFQLEKNMPARNFWQKVIGEYTSGNFENLDGGTQQRFSN
jgi:predicted acetyltransferase